MKDITIDGRHLSYPGTGLALVTAELIQAFQDLGYSKYVSVFVESHVNPAVYGLEKSEIKWIYIDLQSQYSSFVKWIALGLTVFDHIERIVWANAVLKHLANFQHKPQHFIPYLYNYGNLKENVVIIPDLIYRLVVSESSLNPSRPWWWNFRHKLPLKHWFRLWEEQRVIKSNRLVVYSEFVRDCVHQELRIAVEKINLIYLATPSWMMKIPNKDKMLAIRSKYQLPDRFVLYVGGFSLRKNISMLLNACGKAYEADPTFRCVFVGMKTFMDNSNLGFTVCEAMHNSAINAASVPIGNISYEELAVLYNIAEFTVYPSLNEGFGLPILEAAAANKLCLCGNNSSMREIQPNSRYRIDNNDQAKWVLQMLYFWQNPEFAKKAGEECSAVVQKYSWTQSAEALWQLLQS